MSGGDKPVPIEVLVSNALGKGVHLDELGKRLAEIERLAKAATKQKKAGE